MDKRQVSGWRHSTGWAKDQRVYFAAEFSKPFEKFETIGDNYARASFRTTCLLYTSTGHILLNLGEGLTNESGAMVRRVSATEIEGTKLLGTF